jgi:reverse gyrase
MKLKKMKRHDYLMIKLNKRDAKYLKNFLRYEHPQMVRKTENFFGKVLALHIKSVFVTTAACLLKNEKALKQKEYEWVFRELNGSLRRYAKTVDKYFKKLGKKLG